MISNFTTKVNTKTVYTGLFLFFRKKNQLVHQNLCNTTIGLPVGYAKILKTFNYFTNG